MKREKARFTVYQSDPIMYARPWYKRRQMLYSEFEETENTSPSVYLIQRNDEIIRQIPLYIREQIQLKCLIIRFAFKTSKSSPIVTCASTWIDFDRIDEEFMRFPDDIPTNLSGVLADWCAAKGIVPHPNTPREVAAYFNFFLNVIPQLSECFTIH